MFWADRIAGEVEKKFSTDTPIVIRDEKTVSGRVHVGSMRGVAIHGAIAEALSEKAVPNAYAYELNDFDVFDTAPEYLPKEFDQYIGMLLKDVPSPDPAAKSFAEFYGNEFQKVIEESGWHPKFYWGSELYLSGKMDNAIRTALERRADIRRIYKETSGSQKEEDWYPLSVLCEQCKKITDSRILSFDGSFVEYECKCGKDGTVSPFGGNAKLPWKVEWAAKWKVLQVMVEGAGKDHSTRGGSRDVASHISKEIFNYEPPFDVPYEFFLVGGGKMSSSKGKGSSAKEIADLVPPKIFRLALLGKDINQAFNFDPQGDTIPTLYDQYDKLAEGYWAGTKDDYARLFELLHTAAVPSQRSSVLAEDGARPFARALPPPAALPRFSQVAFMVQMPHLDIKKEFPDADPAELEERAMYAKRWLDAYAPEKYVFKLQDSLPEKAKALSDTQKQALGEILRYIEGVESYTGENLHQELHAIKEKLGIPAGEMFKAIYLAFLGRESGPQAGWFLSGLDKAFVLKRLKEVGA